MQDNSRIQNTNKIINIIARFKLISEVRVLFFMTIALMSVEKPSDAIRESWCRIWATPNTFTIIIHALFQLWINIFCILLQVSMKICIYIISTIHSMIFLLTLNLMSLCKNLQLLLKSHLKEILLAIALQANLFHNKNIAKSDIFRCNYLQPWQGHKYKE